MTGRFAAVAQRHESAATQRLRLFTHISDRPGEFAALLGAGGRDGRDLVTVDHMRERCRCTCAPPASRCSGRLVGGAERADAIVVALGATGDEGARYHWRR